MGSQPVSLSPAFGCNFEQQHLWVGPLTNWHWPPNNMRPLSFSSWPWPELTIYHSEADVCEVKVRVEEVRTTFRRHFCKSLIKIHLAARGSFWQSWRQDFWEIWAKMHGRQEVRSWPSLVGRDWRGRGGRWMCWRTRGVSGSAASEVITHMFTGTRVPGTWHQEGEEFCLEAMTIWDPTLLWLKEQIRFRWGSAWMGSLVGQTTFGSTLYTN